MITKKVKAVLSLVCDFQKSAIQRHENIDDDLQNNHWKATVTLLNVLLGRNPSVEELNWVTDFEFHKHIGCEGVNPAAVKDLLAACEECVSVLDGNKFPFELTEEIWATVNIVRAAIAAAKP